MALPTAQYFKMKQLVRGALSVDGVAPSDADVLNFFGQLFTDSSGATALSALRQFVFSEAFRRVVSGDSANPSDADVVAFLQQLQTDSIGLTMSGNRYLTMKNAIRSSVSVDSLNPSPTDVLSYFSSVYNWQTDTRLLGRWKAGSLTDLSGAGVFGNLVSTGGTVTTATNVLDGNSSWQFTKGAGISLQATVTTNFIYNPFTIFIIARSTGTPAVGDTVMSSAAGLGGPWINYNAAGSYRYSGATNITIACTPANFNLLSLYAHGPQTRYGVNGAAWTVANSQSDELRTLAFGTIENGTLGWSGDILEIVIVEGQPSAAFMAGITAYFRSQYPSLGVAASPPASFSVDQTTLGGLFSAPFDIIAVGGQSNNCTMSTGATQAPGTGVFMLGRDNNVQALPSLYMTATGLQDFVEFDSSTGAGGNATSLANTYHAATGRPCVIVPCAASGSGFFPVGTLANNQWWDASQIRGFKLRNALYGSMLARIKNLIALGGTYRFLWWYQGETEAIAGGAPLANHKANTLAMFSSLASDLGLPQRVVVQPIANTLAGATAPNIATMQTNQAAMALAGQIVVGTPWAGAMNADNVHLGATGCDTVGTAAANLALAQTPGTGWY